ncbi:Glycosyl transferase family 2 [Pseudarthrobacter enclensis]|uniref:4,4'-diaponeurosporenoate glycosyltransferase n=1 Tax=Pseudarthrobacter enclensis TaxID=993070 RepID=A0A0V8I4S0_9MICC|nr:glycosyltransferase [Pseudarthrobacter enclensis]KSU69377.1 glycosyl transferase [Pseudarthrobacter enclensis]SCC32582.1 Glycosyl transferase family 2 [Pseudarthrobacter enclensis]
MTVPAEHGIRHVGVVIPAHNEERHLAAALTAVRTAVDTLNAARPGVSVRVVVVLDACTDRSGTIARTFAAADARFAVQDVDFRNVGGTRREGIRAVLAGAAARDVPDTQAWIANTDADSRVPPHWLTRQVELADAGSDAVLGSVEPDRNGMDAGLVRAWHARHHLREHHPHIHGANLGVRASAYLAAGGFPAAESGEDRSLVKALRSSGAVISATDTNRVVTSGRLEARAPRGFAGYLLALALGSSGGNVQA